MHAYLLVDPPRPLRFVSFKKNKQEEGTEANNTAEYGDPDNVYPFGVDPAWHIAGNEVLNVYDVAQVQISNPRQRRGGRRFQ